MILVSNSFLVLCLVWMPFIFFFLPDCFGYHFQKYVEYNGERGHSCLVLYFRGNTFNFSPLSMIFVEVVSYMAFIMFRYFSSIPIEYFNYKLIRSDVLCLLF